jgi:hypothetical protein
VNANLRPEHTANPQLNHVLLCNDRNALVSWSSLESISSETQQTKK